MNYCRMMTSSYSLNEKAHNGGFVLIDARQAEETIVASHESVESLYTELSFAQDIFMEP